jgi:hypothetical protein
MKLSLSLAALLLFLSQARPVAAEADDLNTQLMLATVKIANERSTATAFLLHRPVNGRPEGQYVLVTAAHVLEQMVGDTATLFFRHREAEGVYKKLPLKLDVRKAGKPLWTKHPAVDVAALAVVPPPGADVPKLSLELLATDEDLKRYRVHPGDTVMGLGYPHRFEANEAGFPVLRSGPIASFPLWPTRTTKTFLMHYNAFEGDSGGPVYLADPGRLVGGKRQPQEVRLLLGLVVGQHFIDEQVKMLYETRKVRHRLGMAIVVHASFIRETVERMPDGR